MTTRSHSPKDTIRSVIVTDPAAETRSHGAEVEIPAALPRPVPEAVVPEAVVPEEVAAPGAYALDQGIERATRWLVQRQDATGYWVAEFEADTTLESYFILFKVFMGRADHPSIPQYAKTIRKAMLPQGGWPIYRHGPPELSVSILSYFALKLAGVPENDPGMQRSRQMILDLGGVTKANTYTKIYLAFFGQYDWSHVPAVPPEMILLPTKAPVRRSDTFSTHAPVTAGGTVVVAPPTCSGGEEARSRLAISRPPFANPIRASIGSAHASTRARGPRRRYHGRSRSQKCNPMQP